MGRGSSKASGGSARGNSGSGKPNEATEYYVSGEGMWINQYLRGRGDFGELSENEKEYLKELDKATNGKITDEVLYRNVDATAVFGNISDVDYDNLRASLVYGQDSFGKGAYADGVRNKVNNFISNTEGKVITEKGFISTTTSQSVAQNWGDFTGSELPIVLKIKPSKSTKGVNLSGYDKNVPKSEAQHERLLARNQKYKVKKVYAKDGYIYVDADM